MTIEFQCPTCAKVLKTADDKAGVRAKCPGCGNVVMVPAAGDLVDAEVGAYEEESAGSDGTSRPPPIPSSAGDTKPCPMCGERIKAAATRCRFCGEDLVPGGMSRPVAGELIYAGFWLRFVAAFLDGLILLIPSFILGFVLAAVIVGAAQAGGANGESAAVIAQLVAQVSGFLMQWLYGALMESSAGQATFGKRALGLYVTDLDGRRLTFGRATGRHFGKLLSSFTCLVGYIMAGFTERKQALHDMVASTLVLRRPN